MLMLYIRDYIRESTTARTENSHSSHDPLTALGLLLVGKLGATSVNKRVSSLWLTTGVTLDGRWWLVVRTHNAQPITTHSQPSQQRRTPPATPMAAAAKCQAPSASAQQQHTRRSAAVRNAPSLRSAPSHSPARALPTVQYHYCHCWHHTDPVFLMVWRAVASTADIGFTSDA
jgi:hypothetical protein